MSGMVNRVPALIVKRGLTTKEFVAYCMLKGMGTNTAYRLARGDTDNYTVESLAMAAEILKVKSIAELVDIDDQQWQ